MILGMWKTRCKKNGRSEREFGRVPQLLDS